MSVFYRQRPYPPAERMAERIQAGALARGALVDAGGGQADGEGDLVMLGPPLTITEPQVDEAVTILSDAIAAATRT
jgi:4-aminobutyrate aminotransferase-like enzyme